MTRVSRSLYRSLLKIAKQFDNSPSSKALIYRKSLSNIDKGASSIYYTELLDKLFKKESYLYQPWGDVTSLRELIRSHSYHDDKKTSESDRLDVGFAVLRKLSSLWNSFISLDNNEYDECDYEGLSDNAKHFSQLSDSLMLSNRVALSENLSSGVILVAHPMLQGPLHRCVILLLEHNSKGSYGVVINRGTNRTVESSVKNLPANLLEVFGGNSIAFGGMVRRLTYLHDVQQVGGVPIPTCKTPMYAGGPTLKAVSFVKDSGDPEIDNSKSQKSSNVQQCDPAERFRFFVGCCLWEADELEKELNSGYWIPVHSEPDTLLKLAMPTSAEIIELGNSTLENNSSDNIDSKNSEIVDIVIKAEGIVEENIDGEIRKPTIQEIMDSVASNDDDEFDEDYDHEENYGVDTWKILLRSLGEPFSSLAELPKRFSAKNIESADFE
jgi:putative AlgH/UPF0301 family transcriptional regulator